VRAMARVLLLSQVLLRRSCRATRYKPRNVLSVKVRYREIAGTSSMRS